MRILDKKALAVSIVEYASKLLKLSNLDVRFEPGFKFPNKHISAVFLPEFFAVVFNEDWIKEAMPEDIILTALHEARHAYQKANIDFPYLFENKESEATIMQWKKDFERYEQPDEKNLAPYILSSVEKDAVAFSRKIAREHFDIHFKDNPDIKI